MVKKTKSKKSKKDSKSLQNDELSELQDIKKLLVLLLLKSDVKPESIIKILNIDQGNFSRTFPVRELIK